MQQISHTNRLTACVLGREIMHVWKSLVGVMIFAIFVYMAHGHAEKQNYLGEYC